MNETILVGILTVAFFGVNQIFINHFHKHKWWSLRVADYLIYGSVMFGSVYLLISVFLGMMLIRVVDLVLDGPLTPIVNFLDRFIFGGPLEGETQ